MAKLQMNMRVDGKILDVFKTKADSLGLTQVEYFEKIMKDGFDNKNIDSMSAQIKSKNNEIEELENRTKKLELELGKKTTETCKISFTVTPKIRDHLTKIAHEKGVSRCDLLIQNQTQNPLKIESSMLATLS